MLRTEHRGLSHENTGLDTDVWLKNPEELTGFISRITGINIEDYLKKIQDLTWMLVSRIQRN